MIPPVVRTALGPYLRPAFDMWRGAGEAHHVVLILEGTEGINLYCLSVVDAQCALAEADLTDSDPVARMALKLAESPGEGRFWLLYMMESCLGLISFRWREYVARSMN